MKNKKLIIIQWLVIALLLLTFVFFQIIHKKGAPSSPAGKGKILYYRAPMDATYISDKPGKSPMGMDLIPVYEEEGTSQEAAGGVRINPVTVQNIGVRTELIKRRDLIREIRTIGRIDYDERKIAYINTKVGGWIEKLYADYTGKSVKKGEKLLEIYSPELVATQEEYLLALEYTEKLKESKFTEISKRADSLLESSRKRLKYWDITDEQIEELTQTRKAQKTLALHSPVEGIIIHKNALEGKYTKPGENLYRIADISRIWVYADIYEYELPWIKTGQEAEISLSYLPGKTFKGKVVYVYPYLEAKTRTVKVRIEFANPNWDLKPEMYTDVKINTEVRKKVLAVPQEAVIHSGIRKVIIIDKGKGLFMPRDVKLGLETREYYEIISGVKEGERVVTSSQFLIDSESQLKAAISKMLEVKKPESPAQTEEIHSSKTKMKAATQRIMDEVWENYFVIRKELSVDSLAYISKEARLIQENLQEVLDSDERKEMKELAGKISKNISNLLSEDIVKVREGFLELSEGMIKYMQELDRENSRAKEYKLFFCSMDEKYWIQKEEETSNPYLGKTMSKCGAQEAY